MTFRDTDKLSDNWRFTDRNKPVTSDTIDAYLEKHGEERTLGYLEAIADVKAEIAWMLDSVKPVSGGFQRSPSKTQTMLTEFEKHKKILLEHAKKYPIAIADEALLLKLKQK